MEEKIIGTWIDRKPLYCATFSTTIIGGNNGVTFGITDIDIAELHYETIVKIKSNFYDTRETGGYYDGGITFETNGKGNIITHVMPNGTKDIIRIRNNAAWWDGATAYITLWYTKKD